MAGGNTTPAFLLGGATAAVGVAGAKAKNDAVDRSIDSAREAASFRQSQIARRAGIESAKSISASRKTTGRIRVSGAARGVGSEGISPLILQQGIDTQAELDIIGDNLSAENESIRSQFEAQTAALAAQRLNKLLAAFQGGMSGLQTGLNIAGAFQGGGTAAATTNTQFVRPTQ